MVLSSLRSRDQEMRKSITTPQNFEDATHRIANEIADLLIMKQKDYGKSNILDFGEYGILVRTNDKVARLKELVIKNKTPANEKKTDSWKDIAGYALLALMLERGWFQLPLR